MVQLRAVLLLFSCPVIIETAVTSLVHLIAQLTHIRYSYLNGSAKPARTNEFLQW